MTHPHDIDALILEVDQALTTRFTELVRIAKLDPAADFRYANLQGVDFSGQDIREFDFTCANLRGCAFKGSLIHGARFERAVVDVGRLREAADWEAYSSEQGWFHIHRALGLKFRWPGYPGPPNDVVSLSKDIPVAFEEGGAVPGDRIVGVLMEGEGLRIFHIHSPRLTALEDKRWVDVTWDLDPATPERFPACIMVTAHNQPLALSEIAQIISQADAHIDNIRTVERLDDRVGMRIDIEVWDLDHLTRIVAALRNKETIMKVERLFA